MRERILAILLILLWASNVSADKILVVESYHQEYSWDASYKRGLEEGLGDNHELTFFQMDTKRLPKSKFQAQADAAWDLYNKENPKLVILGDDNALKYLGPKLAKTNTPVVYLGINRNPRDYLPSNAHNFTGVLERPLFKRSIATISKIVQPKPKKVLVLFDSGTTSKAAVAEAFEGSTRISVFNVDAHLRLIGSWGYWRSMIKNASQNKYDAIIVGLYHTLRDWEGKHIPASEVIKWTKENSSVPIFGFWDFAVGSEKTTGGLVLSGEEQGRMAASISKRILDGTPPRKIFPKVAEMGRYLFSQSQMNNHEFKLPKNIASRATWID